jgi:hypothetical protein
LFGIALNAPFDFAQGAVLIEISTSGNGFCPGDLSDTFLKYMLFPDSKKPLPPVTDQDSSQRCWSRLPVFKPYPTALKSGIADQKQFPR